MELTARADRRRAPPRASASRRAAQTAIERVISLVLLGDLVSIYLAVLRGVDPDAGRGDRAAQGRAGQRLSARPRRRRTLTRRGKVGPRWLDALTIHEAAETTGWSPRMLRYIERAGCRAAALGLRLPLYGPAELQRLRTLRELLDALRASASRTIGFALRMRRDADLREAVEAWFEAEPRRPEHVAAADWLRWEQHKHERLLAAAAPSHRPDHGDRPP